MDALGVLHEQVSVIQKTRGAFQEQIIEKVQKTERRQGQSEGADKCRHRPQHSLWKMKFEFGRTRAEKPA